MIIESKERREIPSSVLFHGTTLTRFNQFLMPDGSYQDLTGERIWFDENTTFPLIWARMYEEKHKDDGVLLIARSDMLSLQRPPNAIASSPYHLTVPKYWTTHILPPKSFVYYNITKDALGLYDSNNLQNHLQKMKELCAPLGVLP